MLSTRRLVLLLLGGGLGAGLSLWALHRLSQIAASPNAVDERVYWLVLSLAGLGLGALLLLTLVQLWRFVRYLRRNRASAKLSLSLSLMLLTTTLIPVGVSAYFSWHILSLDLDKAFNVKFNQALDDSLQLTNAGIQMRVDEALQANRNFTRLVASFDHPQLLENIEPLRNSMGALSLAVFDEKGIGVAFASRDLGISNVAAPQSWEISRVNETEEYFNYGEENGRQVVKVITLLPREHDNYYLAGTYAMPEAFNVLADNVRASRQQQQNYYLLRPQIRSIVYLTLILVFLLALLLCLWLSALFSQYMTAPLSALIEATRSIGRGDYLFKIKDLPHNELGNLARHFNTMSERIASAQKINEQNQRQLARQNAYLEGVMANISAGVLVLDRHFQLQQYNEPARQMFSGPPSAAVLAQLSEALREQLGGAAQQWQKEITLNVQSARKILMCHGGCYGHDWILVLNDLTEFTHNQRNEAWEEVAKRLAHEIKNPLTPIQLQTERLQLKLAPALATDKDRDLLQRATNTIINQVAVLKTLVAEFGQFARPLQLRQQPLQLEKLLGEMVDLYQQQLQMELVAESPLPPVNGDPMELRQVLVNLCKNALEAGATRLRLSARVAGPMLQVEFDDNGGGFGNLQKDPFEPYVTSKSTGTGLGLAIVKKIIHEHGGEISAGNGPVGACITLKLPLTAAQPKRKDHENSSNR